MRFESLALPGVGLVHLDVRRDVRGAFCELYQAARYSEVGITGPFVQTNLSVNEPWVIRGLHWQRARPQGKLLTVVRGAILDVVVEVRPASPRYGQHLTVRLDAGSGRQLWVPPGYAHGFCALEDGADVLYAVTDLWSPGDAFGCAWDDPQLAIVWPTRSPVLSEADAQLPNLAALGADALPMWS